MPGPHYIEIAIHLASAWAAGALIGFERSYHGRPAGFRTHALVCLASALLMLITQYHQDWLPRTSSDAANTILDPQRMAQGIMTGIGFLGAGVIFKEGLTVRGLTTAASIWITAALGILYGVGFFYPAILGTIAVLGTLALFLWIENRMPTYAYAQLILRFRKQKTPGEPEVRKLIGGHGFTVANMNYRMEEPKHFEYRMSIRTQEPERFARLAEMLRKRKDLLEFRISPTGD
jgi:putative Mg2+ transporter-C (MgtC) family protein